MATYFNSLLQPFLLWDKAKIPHLENNRTGFVFSKLNYVTT